MAAPLPAPDTAPAIRYTTMDQIKRANQSAGQHWFSPGTMRWFHSRILPTVYPGNYFITSEQREYYTPRCYTIRRADGRGHIETIGEFMDYETAADARKAARQLARAFRAAQRAERPSQLTE